MSNKASYSQIHSFLNSKIRMCMFGFMKRVSIKHLICLSSIATLLLLNACQPDSDDDVLDPNQPSPTGYVYTANINGTAWKATINVSSMLKVSDRSPFKRMDINALSADGKRLMLSLKDGSTGIQGDGVAIRNYLLTTNIQESQFTYETNGSSTPYLGVSGNLNITACDSAKKLLSGSFSAILVKQPGDTVRVTNGVIKDIPYTVFD